MIFFVRRFVLIFFLVIMPNKINIACLIHMLSTFIMVCYIANYKPYSTKTRNIQEFFNEITILLSVYCMIGFTDFPNID